MLTKKDVQIIANLLSDALKKERLFTIAEFAKVDAGLHKLEEKIDKMPTKGEFFDKMDEVVTELQKIRDEQAISEGRITKLEDRNKN